jgi:4-amino-4-deoxy-L-arabinose transferase-like glycosyltransferase
MDDELIRTNHARSQKLDWSDWNLRFSMLLLGVFVIRAVFLFLFPCDLIGDEAYYWDWGRRLDWGYFSKPPFIAWMMGFAGWLGRNTDVGLRLWAVVFGTGSTLFTFLLGRRMYGARAGFWAAALVAATPGAVLINLLLTIDAPLMFFWTAALFLFYAFLNEGSFPRRAAYAFLLMVVLGLGHLSKQMVWLFPVLGVMYLVFDGAEGRGKLRSPLLILSLALSYLFLVPTLVWNAQHGWITFLHTEHHFSGNGILSFPKNFAAFMGMQLGAISPLLMVLVFVLAVGGLFFWRRLASRERYLVAFCGVPLFCITLMTLRQGINGNWAVAFYPAGVILVAGWACSTDALPGLGYASRLRSWLAPSLVVAAVMTAFIYALPFILSAARMEGAKLDPFARMRGWGRYAAAVQSVRETMPRSDAPIIVVGHRYYASELAFYLPDQPRVYHWATPGKIDSQYELWGGLEALTGQDVLIVSIGQDGMLPPELRACLSSSSPRGGVRVDVGNGRMLQSKIFWGGFIGMPSSTDKEGMIEDAE